MEEIIQWLSSNKEWLFSGLGVAVFTLIGGIFFKNKKKGKSPNNQTSGDKSPIINVGGDAKGNTFDFSEKIEKKK
ncbi:hypothetical protein [Flexithrix dorotheae]|uniref:hypothetical protein n=1 Tax=Flexithrix dorotheae TaxID=70993 RepID=UPI0003706A8E|nr:hypothetical protein [Flexithrix dorotheae]